MIHLCCCVLLLHLNKVCFSHVTFLQPQKKSQDIWRSVRVPNALRLTTLSHISLYFLSDSRRCAGFLIRWIPAGETDTV